MTNSNSETVNLKKTVNLPQTNFPARASLVNKEPAFREKWDKLDIYKLLLARPGSAAYTLHDGPPYPNGNIHTGHALNKILKDIVVRSRFMMGQRAAFTPGWDCHGLPIETQVLKAAKKEGAEVPKSDVIAFRKKCHEFALHHVDTQRADFKSLGILGDWESPYLTLDPEYETGTVAAFGKLAEKGLVYRGKKPIHWCMHCETALAEAEIEHGDHRSPSITVRFHVKHSSEKLSALVGDRRAAFWVWTTTPWTLPANVALAVNPGLSYSVVSLGDEVAIVGTDLVELLMNTTENDIHTALGTIKGEDLIGCAATHPFIDRESVIISADFVSAEDGTGIVHIAPGHGQDDYLAGLQHELPMIMPVDSQGRFTDEVGDWVGQRVFESNKPITQHIEALGNLVHFKLIKHSYPHCWRCHNPVIFRATPQWFIAMDKAMPDGQTLREAALSAIKSTAWTPDWGENRITSMVANRPDWCVSRQRKWGIPVPVVTCTSCNHPEMTGAVNESIQQLMRDKGSIAWFTDEASSFLPDGFACSQCGGASFEKERDILDVWFESGSSFMGVLANNPDLACPAQLYLEGSDQHRGWFQSSLLLGIGCLGKAPFEGVLTHGFIVDDKGHKMSKSKGNVTSPADVIKQYGADILRWWVAHSDVKDDVSLSKSILDQSRDAFLKVRNTLRFLLSNLYDFDYETDAVAVAEIGELDQWILSQLDHLNTAVQAHYDTFSFHRVTSAIQQFCAVELSALYMDMVKDRLYCDASTSLRRRATQTVMHHLFDVLDRLLAPIIVTTADDAYQFFAHADKRESVHLRHFPARDLGFANAALDTKFEQLKAIKDEVNKQGEALRQTKEIGTFLQAKATIGLADPIAFSEWESYLNMSSVSCETSSVLTIRVEKIEAPRCERCWKYVPLVTDEVCERCDGALKEKA